MNESDSKKLLGGLCFNRIDGYGLWFSINLQFNFNIEYNKRWISHSLSEFKFFLYFERAIWEGKIISRRNIFLKMRIGIILFYF